MLHIIGYNSTSSSGSSGIRSTDTRVANGSLSSCFDGDTVRVRVLQSALDLAINGTVEAVGVADNGGSSSTSSSCLLTFEGTGNVIVTTYIFDVQALHLSLRGIICSRGSVSLFLLNSMLDNNCAHSVLHASDHSRVYVSDSLMQQSCAHASLSGCTPAFDADEPGGAVIASGTSHVHIANPIFFNNSGCVGSSVHVAQGATLVVLGSKFYFGKGIFGDIVFAQGYNNSTFINMFSNNEHILEHAGAFDFLGGVPRVLLNSSSLWTLQFDEAFHAYAPWVLGGFAERRSSLLASLGFGASEGVASGRLSDEIQHAMSSSAVLANRGYAHQPSYGSAAFDVFASRLSMQSTWRFMRAYFPPYNGMMAAYRVGSLAIELGSPVLLEVHNTTWNNVSLCRTELMQQACGALRTGSEVVCYGSDGQMVAAAGAAAQAQARSSDLRNVCVIPHAGKHLAVAFSVFGGGIMLVVLAGMVWRVFCFGRRRRTAHLNRWRKLCVGGWPVSWSRFVVAARVLLWAANMVSSIAVMLHTQSRVFAALFLAGFAPVVASVLVLHFHIWRVFVEPPGGTRPPMPPVLWAYINFARSQAAASKLCCVASLVLPRVSIFYPHCPLLLFLVQLHFPGMLLRALRPQTALPWLVLGNYSNLYSFLTAAISAPICIGLVSYASLHGATYDVFPRPLSNTMLGWLLGTSLAQVAFWVCYVAWLGLAGGGRDAVRQLFRDMFGDLVVVPPHTSYESWMFLMGCCMMPPIDPLPAYRVRTRVKEAGCRDVAQALACICVPDVQWAWHWADHYDGRLVPEQVRPYVPPEVMQQLDDVFADGLDGVGGSEELRALLAAPAGDVELGVVKSDKEV